MRALLEKGGDLSAPALERLPETLSERVAGRLSHLDSAAAGVLELLAVLGRRAELRSLVAVSGESPDALGEILDQLVRSRFVAEEERGLQLVYEISHPLVQEAVYDGIGAARRRRLHRQVGQALVSGGRLGEAAPHFVRSAEPGDVEAVKVLRDAIHQAEQREAYLESLSILAALADLLPAGDPRWADVADALKTEACAFELQGLMSLDLDRAVAVDALEQAAALFDAGGGAWRRDRVLEVLRNQGSRGRRVAAAALGPTSLTERERDVARLAAQGHSAREIGEKLFIGARTVEGHLARAYAKLGVSSKVELARRAEELGLGPEGGNA